MQRTHVALVVMLALGLAFTGGTVAATDSAEFAASDGPGEVAGASADLTCEFPLEVTDATGEEIYIDEEPEEVVALLPSDAQVMWALGAQEKVVGMPMVDATAYLEDREEHAEDVSEEGFSMFPESEKVIDLDPDLVIAASAAQPDDVEELREAGLTVYYTENENSLYDVYETIEISGQLIGHCEEAAAVLDDMQTTIDEIETALEDVEPVSVYYGMGGGWTAGDNTVEDHMMDIAGAENIAHADDIDFYAEISEEVVINENPDWVIISEGAEVPEEAELTTAVEENQILEVDSNAISQPGPRMIEPIQQMAEAFHPDALEEETDETDDANDVDETTDDTATDDTDDTDDADDADDDATGLTVIAAAIALAGLVIFAVRRL